MHQALSNIQQGLEKIIAQLQATVPSDEPFGNAQGNWTFPGLTRADLIREAQSIIEQISNEGADQVGEQETLLTDYVRRLSFLQSQTIPNLWGNAGPGVAAFMFTLDGLRKALAPVLTHDSQREAAVRLRKLTEKVRGLESQIAGLEPRASSITNMVDRIENAYEAADKLPTDLESLAEARKKVEELVIASGTEQARIVVIREHADEIDEELRLSDKNAKTVLDHCQTAYSAATSVGLAAAFSERSRGLANSMWMWVGGLVLALFAASFFGAGRLQALADLFKDQQPPTSAIIPNMVLSLLSIGAPIWFAWLATKQIGQRFRLAEDYGFKASVARAYEGFRREAARVDKEMEARLLASALTRLDELPLRLIETESHGSPWHELANSDIVKQALRTVPDFTAQVKGLADSAISGIRTSTASKSPATKIEP